MKVLAWFIDPNIIENKNVIKFPFPTALNIVISVI